MKLGFVELGGKAFAMARRLPVQKPMFVGYGPNSDPVAFFSEIGGLASPQHDPSERLQQKNTGLDTRGWTDVWLAAAV